MVRLASFEAQRVRHPSPASSFDAADQASALSVMFKQCFNQMYCLCRYILQPFSRGYTIVVM